MKAYYNENDPHMAELLRVLMEYGLIPNGDVDERSIIDVKAKDLKGYIQCHFFAGQAGWPRALRLIGWPEDCEVWTGSCPCQPFSTAGKHKGKKDKRHLWPEFKRLITKRKPSICFGEQVVSPLGRDWLSGVRLDLEKLGYEVGAADLCAAGTEATGETYIQELWEDEEGKENWDPAISVRLSAPHIRQRSFWVADSNGQRLEGERLQLHQGQGRKAGKVPEATGASQARKLADAGCTGDECRSGSEETHGASGQVEEKARERERRGLDVGDCGTASKLADAECDRRQQGTEDVCAGQFKPTKHGQTAFWSTFNVVPCADERSRRIEPQPQCLADGVSEGVVALWAACCEAVGESQEGPESEETIAMLFDMLFGGFPLAHMPRFWGRTHLLRGMGNAIVPQVAAGFIKAFLMARGIRWQR